MEEAQRLLEDQQRRAESLRTRGGQIAGFAAAVLALIGGNSATIIGTTAGIAQTAIGIALLAAAICLAAAVAIAIWGVILPRPFAAIAADEIANYTSDRFLAEDDLWRVQIRSLRALEKATREIEEGATAAVAAVRISLYGFLTGLAFSLIALGTLILELI